jgi:hypothetical protein
MAIPKVKITFDADLDGLKKGTKGAEDELTGFSGKVAEFGKKAAAAFAVAAAAAVAYAGKLAVDGVRAAIEDEQAQIRLAGALRTATGATNAQIAAVEEQILKTALATGVADDELRPALQRLSAATGSVEKSQKLLNLALDVSKATGKPLEAVTNSLAKAYEGNTSSLAKLGVGLSTAEAKTLGFEGSVKKLTDLYGGAAATNADTFQGRIDKLKVAFDETKESIGTALLPVVDRLLQLIVTYALPAFEKLSGALSGKGEGLLATLERVGGYIKDFFQPIWDALRGAFDKVAKAVEDNKPRLESIIDSFKEIFKWVNDYIIPVLRDVFAERLRLFGEAAAAAIKVVIPIAETVLNAIKGIANTIIDVVNVALRAYNLANNLFGGQDIALIGKIGEATSGVGLGARPFGGAGGTGAGGGGGGTGGGGGGVGGAGSRGGATGTSILGSGVKSAEDLVDKLTKVSDSLSEIQFLYDTGQISKATARKELAAIEKEFAALERVADALTPAGPDVLAPVRGAARAEATYNQFNVTVNGALDGEAVSRQIVTILNDSQARGAIGAGALRTSGGL